LPTPAAARHDCGSHPDLAVVSTPVVCINLRRYEPADEGEPNLAGVFLKPLWRQLARHALLDAPAFLASEALLHLVWCLQELAVRFTAIGRFDHHAEVRADEL
jgi:hypothetical protein